MIPTARHRRTILAGGACLCAMFALTGCHDSPTDPLASLVTAETAPALDIDIALPSLPDLAARTRTEAALAVPVVRWSDSWSADGQVDGEEAARRVAVHEAAPVLAEALGPSGVGDAVMSVDQAVMALDGLTEIPAVLEPVVAQAREEARQAREALRAGRNAWALEQALLASDQLRAVAPEAVARALVARGEAAAAVTDAGADSTIARTRGRRLLDGARQALDQGDYRRAVERAFYAYQLLSAEGGG